MKEGLHLHAHLPVVFSGHWAWLRTMVTICKGQDLVGYYWNPTTRNCSQEGCTARRPLESHRLDVS